MLGVSGGIAAYKAAEITRLLVQRGAIRIAPSSRTLSPLKYPLVIISSASAAYSSGRPSRFAATIPLMYVVDLAPFGLGLGVLLHGGIRAGFSWPSLAARGAASTNPLIRRQFAAPDRDLWLS